MVIYSLTDSAEPGNVRYVGKTADKDKRLREHKRDAGRERNHKSRWLRKVLTEGRDVVLTVIAFAVTDAEASVLERYYIKMFREFGFALTNATAGGDGVRLISGDPTSEEVRRKMSLAKLGKRISEAARGKYADAQRGRKHAPEGVERTAAAHRGVKRSAETCARISAARSGRKATKPKSAETCAKLSAAMKGRPHTPEQIAKQSASLRARNKTPEAKLKMSIAQTRRWARVRDLERAATPPLPM